MLRSSELLTETRSLPRVSLTSSQKTNDIRLTIGFVASLTKQINKISSAPHALLLLLHQTWMRSAWLRKPAHEVWVEIEVKYAFSEHHEYFDIFTARLSYLTILRIFQKVYFSPYLSFWPPTRTPAGLPRLRPELDTYNNLILL